MMKPNFIYCLLVCICLASCNKNTPNTFTLEGEIDGLNDSTELRLSYLTLDNDKWTKVRDSAYIINNRFTFKGNINELTAALLEFENDLIRLYIEPTTMKLKIDKNRPWDYKLSGTKAEAENLALRKMLEPNEQTLYNETNKFIKILEQINSYTEETPQRDSLINVLQLHIVKLNDIREQINRDQFDYVLKNRSSRVSCDLIYIVAQREFSGIDTLKSAYGNMSDDVKMTTQGKMAHKQLERAEKIVAGKNIIQDSIAPNFSGKDMLGNNIQLSDFYNKKYILLDFWASWCQPCMKQVPSLKEINKNYKDKGLQIIGISSDTDTNQWKNAVASHKLDEWPQILSVDNPDNNYFFDDISDLYQVKYIPRYFLINSQGKIVAQWDHLGDAEVLFLKDLLIN